MHILGFGTYDVRTHPRVGVLLAGLRAAGHQVAELNRPLGIGTSGRVAALHSPVHLLGFAFTLLSRWSSLTWGSRSFRGTRRPDALLVGYMGHFDVLLARVLFPRTTIILDHLIFAADTAKDRGAQGSLKSRLLGRLDSAALSAADVIVVDTPAHRDMVPDQLRARCVVVPVGAPQEWFDARRPAQPTTEPLSVVFFGLFTPLQGTPAIARALREAYRRTNIEITVIGSGQDFQECRTILNDTPVKWIAWVDAEKLPAVVAAHDVCIGILGTTTKALHVVPNKVFQGMAAGCAVITSDTPPQRELLGDAVLWCPPGASEDLASALCDLASNTSLLESFKRRSSAYADEHFRPALAVTPLLNLLRKATQ